MIPLTKSAEHPWNMEKAIFGLKWQKRNLATDIVPTLCFPDVGRPRASYARRSSFRVLKEIAMSRRRCAGLEY
jgi:hypothetical protein